MAKRMYHAYEPRELRETEVAIKYEAPKFVIFVDVVKVLSYKLYYVIPIKTFIFKK